MLHFYIFVKLTDVEDDETVAPRYATLGKVVHFESKAIETAEKSVCILHTFFFTFKEDTFPFIKVKGVYILNMIQSPLSGGLEIC